MFSAAHRSLASQAIRRGFSTTSSRQADVAKLILIGRLGKAPEVRTTKTDKEYITYTVATSNYPPPPPGPDGVRPDSGTSWHRILSFNANANNYLRTLQKGTHVYVEANYELKEPDASADPDSPLGQRQIFLRHETLRVLRSPYTGNNSEDS